MAMHVLIIALAAGAALAILLLAVGLAQLAMREGGRRKTDGSRLPTSDRARGFTGGRGSARAALVVAQGARAWLVSATAAHRPLPATQPGRDLYRAARRCRAPLPVNGRAVPGAQARGAAARPGVRRGGRCCSHAARTTQGLAR